MTESSYQDTGLADRAKVMSLSSAVSEYVEPGLHLHFASTPSRSNAAIREVARQYAGTRPAFTLSSIGMHSTAHLLGLLGLGARYIACFYGDCHPVPRPSALYQRLEFAEADLEHWSLSSFIAAFRAGARGEQYAITRSLRGTELASQLARRGRYYEVPDPRGGEQSLSLVAAMRSDVTFLHAAVGDEDGNALFSAPHYEGFHAALGAKRGVIVTVERVVPRGALRRHPDRLLVSPRRVLAVCHASRGAHPESLHVEPAEYRGDGYEDDTVQHEIWRRMAEEPELFERYREEVLGAVDADAAHMRFNAACRDEYERERPTAVINGPGRNASKPRYSAESSVRERPQVRRPREQSGMLPVVRSKVGESREWGALGSEVRATLLAARAMVRRVEVGHVEAILATSGPAFAAARLASILLGRSSRLPELLVETGLSDVEPRTGDSTLLGYRNVVGAKRLTDAEHVVGTVACGCASRCLGVVGGVQVDERGNVNTTRIAGRLLTGSGGANDVTSAADEVIVLMRARAERFPRSVDFVTMAGWRVRSIVTEYWELHRDTDAHPWRVAQWIPSLRDGRGPLALPEWVLASDVTAGEAAPPTKEELQALRWLSVPEPGWEALPEQQLDCSRRVS